MPRNTWHRTRKAKGRRGMVYLYEAGGVYRGRDVWWAWGTSLRSGDRVSIDWTDDGGAPTTPATRWSEAADAAASRRTRWTPRRAASSARA
ncbi:hypothetical protein [Nonomuraea sp. NPDC049758]|uniref:hypothetical protein n=1 Tax=Nonomuraea sp. NPDC049758 TaxID=3154360 RepID=UPI003425A878